MNLQIGLAFAAGLLSFLSPCTLPLYPAYISRLTGLSYKEIADPSKSRQVRNRIIAHTAVFILGISLIYFMLGFSATLFGQWLIDYREWIRIGSGILFIVMGFILVGILRLRWFIQDRRAMNIERPVGSYLGSFLLGFIFAYFFTACHARSYTLRSAIPFVRKYQ